MTKELERLFIYTELYFIWKRRSVQGQNPVELERSHVRCCACCLTFFQRILNRLGLGFEALVRREGLCDAIARRGLIYQYQIAGFLQRETEVDLSPENLKAGKYHIAGTIRPEAEIDTTVEVPRDRDLT